MDFKYKLIIVLTLSLLSYLLMFQIEYFCNFVDNKLGCYEANVKFRFSVLGLDNSIGFIEKLFAEDYINQGQCHTLGHSLGRISANTNSSITDAMEGQKSFCGWAYFHGLMEGLFNKNSNHGSLTENAYQTCQAIPKDKSIDIFNCFHALGHGLYSVDYDLINALRRCDDISGSSNKGFCYDGVFMANTFSGWGVNNKYLRSDNPIFPCDMVGEEYKEYCYWRNVPINIFTNNTDVPEIAKKYEKILWNGLGRELDSRTNTDYEKIIEFCLTAGDNQGECLAGAARHMIFYDKGSTSRANNLCKMTSEKEICFSKINSSPLLGP